MLRKINSKLQSFVLAIVDFIYVPFKKFFSQQIFRYGICGGANLVFDWVLYYVFFNYVFSKQVVHINSYLAFEPHIASFFFTFPITFLSGFWLLRYVSFVESNLRGRVQIVRYLSVVLSNILFTYLMLKFFVEICHFFPTPSKILITVITTVYSYVMQKYFSFKTKLQ